MTQEDKELIAWVESFQPEEKEFQLSESTKSVDIKKTLEIMALRMKINDGNHHFDMYKKQLLEWKTAIEEKMLQTV